MIVKWKWPQIKRALSAGILSALLVLPSLSPSWAAYSAPPPPKQERPAATPQPARTVTPVAAPADTKKWDRPVVATPAVTSGGYKAPPGPATRVQTPTPLAAGKEAFPATQAQGGTPAQAQAVTPARPVIAMPKPTQADVAVRQQDSKRALDDLAAKQAQAKHAEQARINAARARPEVASFTGGRTYQPAQVAQVRGQWYHDHPNIIIVGSPSRSYGIYTAAAMAVLALDGVWLYNHWNDPYYLQYRQEQQLAALQNENLRLQMAAAEQQRAALIAQNAPINASYVPASMPPPEAALSQEVLTGQADLPELDFATGPTGGNYYALCAGDRGDKNTPSIDGFKAAAQRVLKINCKATGGSGDNVVELIAGTADAAVVQSDVMAMHMDTHPGVQFGARQMLGYEEDVLFFANDQGPSNVRKLDEHHTMVVVRNSGPQKTWENIRAKKPGVYGKVHTRVVDSNNDAMMLVAQDKNTVMLLVMGLNSQTLRIANDQFGDKIRLVPFDDPDFDTIVDAEGRPVYHECSVPSGKYSKLQEGWFSSSVATRCVTAVLVLSEQWVAEHGENAENAFIAVSDGQLPVMRLRVGG